MRVVFTRAALVTAAVCCASTSVGAQPHVVLRGLGAVTFGQTTATGVMGAGVGIGVSPRLQATVEVARDFRPAIPRNPSAGASHGIPDSFTLVFTDGGRLDRYVLGGVRLNVRETRHLRVFGDGGVGRGRLATRYVDDPFGRTGDTASGALVAGGGGISVPVMRHVDIEVAYRHGRLFLETYRLRTNDVRLGVGLAF